MNDTFFYIDEPLKDYLAPLLAQRRAHLLNYSYIFPYLLLPLVKLKLTPKKSIIYTDLSLYVLPCIHVQFFDPRARYNLHASCLAFDKRELIYDPSLSPYYTTSY